MTAASMSPATAVSWGPFIQAAYDQFAAGPQQPNPAAITNMPAGFTLVRTIQMTDFLGPAHQREFYGFVAVGGNPQTAVVALRGTATATEWWDDLHWDLAPFAQVANGGSVAQGFLDIYNTFGTMTPGQQQPSTAARASPPTSPYRSRPLWPQISTPHYRSWCAGTVSAVRSQRCWSRTWPRTHRCGRRRGPSPHRRWATLRSPAGTAA